MQKKSITILTIVIILAGVLYFTQNNKPRLEPLPTKDNPTSAGLYSNVPQFQQWEWKEERDNEGQLIYRIKLPHGKNFVINIDEARKNNVLLILDPSGLKNYLNITEYISEYKEEFDRKFISDQRFSNIGQYFSYHEHDFVSEGTENNYVLTKKRINNKL